MPRDPKKIYLRVGLDPTSPLYQRLLQDIQKSGFSPARLRELLLTRASDYYTLLDQLLSSGQGQAGQNSMQPEDDVLDITKQPTVEMEIYQQLADFYR